ncbi:hypothetical protein ASZ78_001737 [Callipepla squamata]|uniref:RNA-binding region-containing protein 3 n=1 Tax=Callipepla squamata TaxID=9009 RepID=A0A226N2I7_CALSU|nr:hypothetical protein ASZ78_001737 [Callipepla squamata]
MAASGGEEERAGGAGPFHLGVARRRGRTLLVRHLPAELTAAEKEDLLQHFGAVAVRVLSDRGRLKHTAFATFPSENAALKALSRLHQLKLLGHTLVVEFAKEQDSVQVLSQPSLSDKCKSINLESLQVLHLMNKMNLPPPFGPITARPPMYEEYLPVPVPPPPIPPLPPEEPPLPEEEEEQMSSGDESEYQSDNEEEKESNLHPALSPSDVFEQPQHVGHKKIEFHITTDIPSVLQIKSEREENNDLYATTEEINNTGFGRIFPTPSSNDKMETEEEDEEIPSEFISRRELEKNRLSREEMEKFSVFKNYEPGEPNCRIYVKNLAKQVQEKVCKQEE